jgi:poly-beta-hydroxybutyrate-responsive repressor
MAKTSPDYLAQCPCSGKTLERLIRPAVLLLLAQEPLYGYKLVQRLMEMPMFDGQKPNAAGVYRTLKALAVEELVVPSWELSASGPAKRLYTLTPKGEHCLASWILTLSQYRLAIDALLAMGQDVAARWRAAQQATPSATP